MAGNITKLKDGSYRLRYRDCSTNVQAKTDRAAEKLLAKFITEVDAGDFTQPSKVTFEEFTKKWLEKFVELELAPKTVFRYKQILNARILPRFGKMRLEKIKPLDLVEFYKSLKTSHKYLGISRKDGTLQEATCEGLSDKSIRHHHAIICAIFEKAIKWGVFKGENPGHHVDAPKVARKQEKHYDLDEVRTMIKALEKEELHHQVAVMIALNCGMRLGEVCGLEWQDIWFDKGIIEVRQTSQYLPGQGVFTKAPKTESSKRRISANKALLGLLRVYQKDQQEKGFLCADNNRLFVTWDGKPAFPNAISKWFTYFIRRNNLPPLNFHGLRHTSATFLISQGMDVQTVAGCLGHSTSATTHNIYSHFLESKDKQAADLMESAFGALPKDNSKKA
ncbi:MAG: tyrosine-type recombinase/integrase [Desulfitobacterium sp.]